MNNDILSRRQVLRASVALAALAIPTRYAFAASDEKLPNIQLNFNVDAIARLLDLIAAKDASDASLDALLALPANAMLIQLGEAEGSLTREKLRQNAKAVILGTATAQEQPRGDGARLFITDPAGYRDLLKQLQETQAARSAIIVARLQQFTPRSLERTQISQTIYLHFGGTWDAINKNGDIYVNLHYWHDYFKPSLDGMNLLVAHEMTHTLQNRSYGNPEAQDGGPEMLLTALSKIQREGTARYVETETDPESYEPYTYGFYYRAIDYEALRNFATLPAALEPLVAACVPDTDKDRFADLYAAGMSDGGPFYALGHGIAKTIDERAGRKALLETIDRGPKAFFNRYVDICRKNSSLPALPDSVISAVKSMADRIAPSPT